MHTVENHNDYCFGTLLYTCGFLLLITRNYSLSVQGRSETNRWKLKSRKGLGRGSSVHPITVSGPIFSNQTALLNISKLDSPQSWSSHISIQSLSLSRSRSHFLHLVLYFTSLRPFPSSSFSLKSRHQNLTSLSANTTSIPFFSDREDIVVLIKSI